MVEDCIDGRHAVIAVRGGDAATLSRLFKQNELLMTQGISECFAIEGWTLLHEACSSEISSPHFEIVKLLLERGADVNASTTNESLTPLHEAARRGSVSVVRLLLQWKADVTARTDGYSETPLSLALKQGDVDVVTTLMAAGAGNPMRDSLYRNSWSPLHLAALSGRLDLVKAITSSDPTIPPASCCEKQGAKTNWPESLNARTDEGMTALLCCFAGATYDDWQDCGATIKDREELAMWLVEQGADQDVEDITGMTVMHFASRLGSSKSIGSMIPNGFEPDTGRRRLLNPSDNGKLVSVSGSPLHHAIKGNSISCVQLLLEAGANPNLSDGKGRTPLHYAQPRSLFESRNINRANIEDQEHEIIICEAMITLLLSKGAKIDSRDSVGVTPLHRFCKSGSFTLPLINLLVMSGAEINTVSTGNSLHATPLHTVCTLSQDQTNNLVLAYLVSFPLVNLDIRSQSGLAALHVAAQYGNPAAVRVLIEKGADVDAKDENGRSALHYAAHFLQDAAWDALVSSGADVNLVDNEGLTAASMRGQVEEIRDRDLRKRGSLARGRARSRGETEMGPI